jgi:hypothetical protein
MKGGKRALTPWNMLVKKVYNEGKASNPNYEFKDALKDASKRKGEMGSAVAHGTKKARKSKAKLTKGGRGTRGRRTRRRY